MKKRTIRFRVFIWLAIQTLLNFSLIVLAMFCYDFYEYIKDPGNLPDEIEELFVLLVFVALLLPVSLGAAWSVSRRLLHPWKAMMLQAEKISGGQLGERINVVNSKDEIGRLASTLNLTFDRYQQLLDRMHRFSYDASHQLRNPLASIRTNGEVCLKHPRSEEEYRQVIGGILEATNRLGRTVEQLLLLARISDGTVKEYQQQTCLQEIAHDVVREGRAIGEMRGITVDLDAPNAPLMMLGMPDLLREALANLLDNALKFSPDGGLIRLGMTQPDSGHVRIAVYDFGPGLPPEQKAAVFRPFKKGAVSGKESVGLGLAIVADICQAHAGRFGVEDNSGGGCCFWIELPVVVPPAIYSI